jgi:hypothetical protein
MLRNRIRDPVPLDLRDPRKVKNQDPDHVSESLKINNFWVKKILKFFHVDPGWKKFGSGIRDPG